MRRKVKRSVNPLANDGAVCVEIAAALAELLIKMNGSHSLQTRLANGYEIHAYQQSPHIIRVDLHRLDRQPWHSAEEIEEEED